MILRMLSKRDHKRVLRRARSRTWIIRPISCRIGRKQSKRFFKSAKRVGRWEFPAIGCTMEAWVSV